MYKYATGRDSSEQHQALMATCRLAADLFGADHSGLVYFDSDFMKGQVVAEYPDLGSVGLEIPIHKVKAEELLIAEQAPVIIKDVSNDETLGPVRKILLSLNIQSVLFVPLVVEGLVLGSFSIDMIKCQREFSEDEVRRCKVVADQIAWMIRGVTWADHLQSVRRATLAIAHERNSTALLMKIVEEAVSLLRASSGGVYKYFPERQELEIVADQTRPNIVGNTVSLGEGLAGLLVQQRFPFRIVNNYSTWENRIERYTKRDYFGAVVEVPLVWEEQIIGVLYVDDKLGREFTLDDALRLGLLAEHAAIALINADTVCRVQNKSRKLEKLSTAMGEIIRDLADLSLDERLNMIVKYATDILHAESCGLFLVENPGYLCLKASFGHAEGGFPNGLELPIFSGHKSGLTGHIAYVGEPFNMHGEELMKHPAVTGNRPSHLGSGQCYSLLAIPLKHQKDQSEELIGLLRVDNKMNSDRNPGPNTYFSEEDESILRIFADAAITVIESARLVANQTEALEQLADQNLLQRRLVESSKRLATQSDKDEILSLIAREASYVLDADAAMVWLYDNRSSQFIDEEMATYGFPEHTIAAFLENPPRPTGLCATVLKSKERYLDVSLTKPPPYTLETTRKHLSDLGIKWLRGTALQIDDEPLGVLFIYYKSCDLDIVDKSAIEMFAQHSASALKKAQLLDNLDRVRLGAVTISEHSVLEENLETTLTQVATGTMSVLNCSTVSLFVCDPDSSEIEILFDPVWIGLLVPEKVVKKGKIGPNSAIRRMLEQNDLYVAEDALADEIMSKSRFVRREGVISSIGIPLRAKGQNVGVMFVNYRNQRRFTDIELDSIRLFANQAAIAIHNLLQYQALEQTQRRLAARTVLAGLGIASSTIIHSILNQITGMQAYLRLLDQDIRAGKTGSSLLPNLGEILKIAEDIQDSHKNLPTPSEDDVTSVPLNELVEARSRQLRDKGRYKSVSIETLRLDLPNNLTVKANAQWLRRTLDILVDNSYQAVLKSSNQVKRITLSTRRAGNWAEIVVADTGNGIPENIRTLLGEKLIPKRHDERGQGAGLLMARFIAEAYGGKIVLGYTGPDGTEMAIQLPVE